MESSDDAQRVCVPVTGEKERQHLFSMYHCEGSAGLEVFRQNIAITPGLEITAFGYCFPPPVMAGHIVQHLTEC